MRTLRVILTSFAGVSLLAACAPVMTYEGGPDAEAGAADGGNDGTVLDAPAGTDAFDSTPDVGGDAGDDGASDDALDAGVDAFDAGSCSDAGLGGIGVPSGSMASASSTYASQTPDLAIDGNTSTYWNGSSATASLSITFPSATTFQAVRLEAVASPASSEVYTINGFQGGNPTVIGSSTQNVPNGVNPLAPISVTPGAYDSIRIDVSSSQSWVAIAEVSLITVSCP